ncbi:MAG: hypothetical protein KatS3mg081_2219 [Gemmatimonadales bacterium]|nr:hypothetical protein HRbin33_01027 [bacterium HR33]GIW52864.1 MAG: hypothetical protein KatS3mg081_2219 [Gemmatimonadales bacterium]
MVWEFFQNLPLVKIVIAALLVLLGVLSSRFLESWSERGIHTLIDRVGRRGKGSAAASASEVAESVPALVGRFVYWFVFLSFLAAALELVGLPVVSAVGERLAPYVPGVLAGLGIVLLGVVAASLAGGVVAAGAASTGLRYAGAVGRLAQGLVLLLAILLALEQVGIHGELIGVLLAVFLGVAFSGAALAFGLGARTAVSNILAAYYVTQTYSVGQTVRIGEIEGRIVRTTSTAVVLDTPAGQVQVPASLFSERPSTLVAEGG